MIRLVNSRNTALASLSSPNKPILTGLYPGFIGSHVNNNKISKRHLNSDSFTADTIRSNSRDSVVRRVSILPTPSLRPEIEPKNHEDTADLASRCGMSSSSQLHEPPSRRQLPISNFKQNHEETFASSCKRLVINNQDMTFDSNQRRDPSLSFQSYKLPHRRPLTSSILNSNSLYDTCALTQNRTVVRSQEDSYVPIREDVVINNQEDTSMPAKDKVIILWDLDNKSPIDPYRVTILLKQFAGLFGEVVNMTAFGNPYTCSLKLQSTKLEHQALRERYLLEEEGAIEPSNPYNCSVCDRQFKFHKDMETHFKLHEVEYQNMTTLIESAQSREERQYRSRLFRPKMRKYLRASRDMGDPENGIELGYALKKAGVQVRRVVQGPQAADQALKRTWEQRPSAQDSPYDWLFLVSDDGHFKWMLDKAKKRGVGIVTVCVGGKMSQMGDFWVPWHAVKVGDKSLEWLSNFVLKTATVEKQKWREMSLDEIEKNIMEDHRLYKEERLSGKTVSEKELSLNRILEEMRRQRIEWRLKEEERSKEEGILMQDGLFMKRDETGTFINDEKPLDDMSDEELLQSLNHLHFVDALSRLANYSSGKKQWLRRRRRETHELVQDNLWIDRKLSLQEIKSLLSNIKRAGAQKHHSSKYEKGWKRILKSEKTY